MPNDVELNPYDFVPLEGTPTFLKRPGHERCTGLSGQIQFKLEILSPLCIQHEPGKPGPNNRFAFAHLDGHPTVPATSLKGMLRGVHEVVSNSTMGILKSERRRGWYRARIPSAYLPNRNTELLTPSEALFGTVAGERSGDAEGVGYAGRLLIDDLPAPLPLSPQRVSRPAGGQPKPEHEAFYLDQHGKALGRKFYYHQPDVEAVRRRYANDRRMPEITVETVRPGEQLDGRMLFTNLAELELAQLVYTLVLEEGLAHKLGYGKPLGLGSVRIRIASLQVEPLEGGVPVRFRSYGAPTLEDWTGRVEALRDAARADWHGRARGETSYAAFRAIARWPQTELFIYPPFDFFRQERGAPTKTPLSKRQKRTTTYPGAEPRPTAEPAPQMVAAQTQDVATPRANAGVALPPPGEPRAGRFERNERIGFFIRDERTQETYQLTSDSMPRKLRALLAGKLETGNPPRVRFRPARVGGASVALEVELLGESA